MNDCIPKGSGDAYERARQVGNARFDLFPELICYCKSAGDIRAALSTARRDRLPIRVRSGGHHHEGMCSGDGVMVIDVSPLAKIEMDTRNQSAWVGPGAKNGDIYKALWEHKLEDYPRQIFSGGGCPDVRVGGFLQGGGWGPYSRSLGMGSDRVTGFRMVCANGDEIFVHAQEKAYHDLFRAVCGGGGGNFGVVTEFRIQTAWIEVGLSQFTLSWSDPAYRRLVINEWRKSFPDDADTRLTSFCRVSSPDPARVDAPVLIGGNCLALPDETREILRRLLPTTYGAAKDDVRPVHPLKAADFSHPEYQPGPPLAARQAVPGVEPADLSNTCAGRPYPHKVSSCFPRNDFGDAAVDTIVAYLETSEAESRARRYLSLHCMGGAIRSNPSFSCFAWRDKPFMLQYQAWWADPHDMALSGLSLRWIKDFRERMQSYTEGAFINFPDRDLPANNRRELMQHYYRDLIQDLIDVKKKYDPQNVFDFEMGIPTG